MDIGEDGRGIIHRLSRATAWHAEEKEEECLSQWLGWALGRAARIELEAALASPGTRSSSILKRKNTGETGCGARGAGGVVWG